MLGAIVVSGLARGELISLTLAPLLLVAMIGLIRLGAGPWSPDRWIARKAASGTASIRAVRQSRPPRGHQ
jgi:hypothetical protein